MKIFWLGLPTKDLSKDNENIIQYMMILNKLKINLGNIDFYTKVDVFR